MKTADLIGSDFSVSSYVDDKVKEQIRASKKDSNSITKALEWQDASNIYIITTAETLEELEEQWIAFNSMPIKLRRESDWKSLELFGVTNKDHYEHIRDTLLENDIKENNPSIESNTNNIHLVESTDDYEGAEGYYKDQSLNYGPIDIENAIEWSRESYKIMIIPTRTLAELEFLWTAYQSMVYKHRRESDWKSLELFGVTNLKHYEYLKAEFLKGDVTHRDDYLVVESSQLLISRYLKNNKLSLAEIAKIILEAKAQNNSIYEELLTNNIISDVMDGNIELFNSVPTIELPNGDLPYLSPEEMIDMGVYGQSPADNYYGVLADNNLLDNKITTVDWFREYDLSTKGFYTKFYELSSIWVDKVRGLSYNLKRLKEAGAEENIILAKKQSLLELGWNPEVEFTEKARILAKEMAVSRATETMAYSTVINLEGFEVPTNSNSFFNESSNTNNLKPIFVILIEGKTPIFSDTVKKVTNTIYSHCSISFDPYLRKMYSFGVNGSKHGIRGGFIEEDITNTPVDSRIGVFAFFVSQNIFDSIRRMVDGFKENVDKTFYGYKNLITYLFKIPYEQDWNLICSQFVDKLLKSAGIDITHTQPSLVAPSDINRALKNNRRIYSLYKGLASKYDGSKILNLLNVLISKAKPLKESSSFSKWPKITAKAIPSENPNDCISKNAIELKFFNEKNEYIGEAAASSIDVDDPYAYNIEVFPKFRGQGYGHSIIDYFIKNYNIAQLSVEVDNSIALNLYRKHGFRIQNKYKDGKIVYYNMRRRNFTSECSYIFDLVSNFSNVSTMLEMKQYCNIVSDKVSKEFLENCLFDALDIKPYVEAEEFPVQFDSQGNLLLKKGTKNIDFDAEYAKSHKLLKQYKNSKNIEGIKYELAKLWMMLCSIENNIHNKHNDNSTLKYLRDAKAKINNDFQYYLKFILDNDSEFNFIEYFESSPFYSDTTKINKTTLDAIGRMIKMFIRPF